MNKKQLINLCAFIVTITLVSCANYVLPTASELKKYDMLAENMDITALERGRPVMVQNCVECHRLIYPEELPTAAWDEVLPSMIRKADLQAQDMKDIQAYVHTVIDSVKNGYKEKLAAEQK